MRLSAPRGVVGRPFWAVVAIVLVAAFPALLHGAPPEDQQPSREPVFKTDVRPIFEKHCFRCHDAKGKKGGLDLSTSEGVLAGGESGPVIVPRQPTASRLYDI